MAAKTETTRITKRMVDSLVPGQTIWDAEIRGFGVRCQRRDKVYMLKTRVGGRKRWFTVGHHGSPWTPETARARARKMLSDIAAGHDLAALRLDGRITPPSMADLCARYMVEHAREHNKASSAYTDESNIKNHVLPLLGRLRVIDVTRADIDRFKRDVKDGRTADKTGETRGRPSRRRGGQGRPVSANRCLTLLSKMFNLAERWGWRAEGSNPVRHVEVQRKQARTLSQYPGTCPAGRGVGPGGDGRHRVAVRCCRHTSASVHRCPAFRGAYAAMEARRPGALRSAPAGQQDRRKTIYLSAPALAVPGQHTAGQRQPVRDRWRAQGRAPGQSSETLESYPVAAGLKDLRMHDLRHSFASVAAASGLSLPIIRSATRAH